MWQEAAESVRAGSPSSGTLAGVTIGRSLVGGAGPVSGEVVSSGAMGPVKITGSILGGIGSDSGRVSTNDSLAGISIGGSVKFARIYSGFDKDTGVIDGNGNAQIGTVSVGGDWIASLLESGCSSNDRVVGDNNDGVIAGFDNDDGAGHNTIVARIASITIKGQVIGEPGTDNTSGFLAEQIGSFKYHGITVALKAGAKTDGLAHPVGATLTNAPNVPDGFAVHVFEV